MNYFWSNKNNFVLLQSRNINIVMPKIYEYFGFIFYFYSNEH